MSAFGHVPVLPAEVVQWLAPTSGQTVVDATLGDGGHARLLAEHLVPGGRLIGLDCDADQLAHAQPHLSDLPVTLWHANFDQLPQVLADLHLDAVDAVFADLGVCSSQLDNAERGLSFQRSGPLDMRLDRSAGPTVRDLLLRLSERELADLIYQFG